MIKHIVMWRLKDHTNYGNKEEVAKEVKVRLEALKDKIDEVISIEVGINHNTSEAAYDLVLYSEFNTDEDLKSYAIHPEHVKVGSFIKEITTSRVVTDYEI